MIRIIVGIGFALMSCSVVFADWEVASAVDPATHEVVESVRIADARGNSFVIHKDPTGSVKGYILLNTFLPEPDRLGAATPVVFTVDDGEPHVINEGDWEALGLHRKLAFTLSGTDALGLSEALIDIVEGKRVVFTYPAGLMGYETVSFPLNEATLAIAQTLDIDTPIDHEGQKKLRVSHLRKEMDQKAAAVRLSDPETERHRLNLIDHQLDVIRTRVMDRWVRPARWSGLRCSLQITLMSTGKVLQVALIKSSGDPDFDVSVETAVHDASPLPLPTDHALFRNFQQLEMVFDPAAEIRIESVSQI